MGVDFTLLANQTESIGTAGVSFNFTERASVVFTDPGRVMYVYHIDLEIAEPDPAIIALPSLLGREILDRWRMLYDPPSNRLLFTVRSADINVALG